MWLNILMVIGLVVLLLIFAAYGGMHLQARKRLATRLDQVISPSYTAQQNTQMGLLQKMLQTMMGLARTFVNARFFSPHIRATLTVRLKEAGFFSRQAPDIFIVILISSIIGLGLIFVFLLQINNHLALLVSRHIWLVLFLCIWLMIYLPNKILKSIVASYKAALIRELPDFFELFVICAEAGDSHDQALERVLSVLKYTHKAATQQIAILFDELALLPKRAVAWKHLAERVDIPQITDVIRIIEQCEVLGTPLGKDLQNEIGNLRQMQVLAVEEKIMRLPTLMTIPLVFCILPALLIVLLGPSVLSLHVMHWI